jgi:hypothetical protein
VPSLLSSPVLSAAGLTSQSLEVSWDESSNSFGSKNSPKQRQRLRYIGLIGGKFFECAGIIGIELMKCLVSVMLGLANKDAIVVHGREYEYSLGCGGIHIRAN